MKPINLMDACEVSEVQLDSMLNSEVVELTEEELKVLATGTRAVGGTQI
jgi:hypothetical protein